jgi:glycosyltransferase involved in cell wall biosynthesis
MTDNQSGPSRQRKHSSAPLDERAESAPPLVVVLGATTGDRAFVTDVIAGLGVASARPGSGGDALASFNEQLLSLLGGTWDRPPRLRSGWEHSDEIGNQSLLARAAFGVTFGGAERPAAWSDPLLDLLLPFWRAVLGRPIAAVLVASPAEEVADDLASRHGISPALGLALFDRYLRAALESLAGLPAFLTRPDHFGEPAGVTSPAWLHELVEFLRSTGVKIADHELEADVLPALPVRSPRHSAAAGSDALLPQLTELTAACAEVIGAHDAFQPPRLGTPSGWVEEMLAARSDALLTWRGLEWAAQRIASRPPASLLRSIAPRRMPPPPADTSIDGYPMNATQDEKAYYRWLEARSRPTRLPGHDETRSDPSSIVPRTVPPAGERPLFSVVVPVYRPPLWALVRCVASVLDQEFPSFELCLCDDGSADEELTRCLGQAAALDPRVRVTARASNCGISAATNAAIGISTGEFVVFLDNDDELTPHALRSIAAAIRAEPSVDLLYSDEDKIDVWGRLHTPAFKPGWSPDTLLSCAYMCHLLVVRASLVAALGGLRSDYDGSQDYDLMLRASERARDIVHVPDVLYHWRTMPSSAASGDAAVKPWAYEAGRRALVDAMERRGEPAEVAGDAAILGTYRVRRLVPAGLHRVSVIVPFRDEPSLLTQCVDSVLEAPGFDDIELCLIDNGSVLPETRVLLDELASDPRVVLLEEPGPFNWSALNNAAVAHASGDLLLFMNNDVEATTAGWMGAMVEHAQRPGIGAVGARLLYPNRTIQHAGIVLGMGGIAAHVLQDLPEDLTGYLNWAFMVRNCLAVTGACLMTRREVFDELCGFAEDLPIAFNDVDFCMRIAESGRFVVYTPFAELVHHESRTRGHADDAVEFPRFLHRWRTKLAAGDPYYHPSLTLWRQHCTLATPEEEEKWHNFLSTLDHLP